MVAPNLKPTGTLSQVVFVHDYLQLVFQSESFSVFNVCEVARGEVVSRCGEPGFCDAVVALIGQHVNGVSASSPFKLALTFEDGSAFRILSHHRANGPEAFAWHGPGNTIIVEQNA
ncbi:MAG TPA: hypothetical protein VGI60_01775 [Chthoniobacterales bacterium]|jgi:lipoprotein signal peptidase